LIVIFVLVNATDFIERKIGKAGLSAMRKFFGLILLAIAVKIFKGNF